MDIESALSQLNNVLEDEENNAKFKNLVDMIGKSGLLDEKSDAQPKPKTASSDANDSLGSLGSILNAFTGSSNENKSDKSESGKGFGDLSGIFGAASKLFGSSKVSNAKRIALLDAIEPFLKEDKREKVQTCKKVLKIVEMAKLFENLSI